MSIRISVFENQWGDRLEIYKTYLKIIIKRGLKTSGYYDMVPRHKTGEFTLLFKDIYINRDLDFSETSYSFWGRTHGYLKLGDKAIYFHSENEQWIEARDLIIERCGAFDITQVESRAKEREDALDFDAAIDLWEEIGDLEEAARLRKLRAEQGSVKVAQNVVQGDQITEVKDSVISKSNIGAGGDDKFTRLEKLTEMKKEGLIDDAEFKQMKKEILG
jgi:hypothetical protein